MAAIPAGKGKFIAGGVVGAFLLVLIVSNGSTFNGANQPLNSGQFVRLCLCVGVLGLVWFG